MDAQSEKLHLLANANLFSLGENPYPGRGIVCGLDESGESMVQIYWIMGRSENSRNRVFSREGDRLFTEASDPSRVKDPSLIIYNAMCSAPYLGHSRAHIVSNGNQTDEVARRVRDDDFHYIMSALKYEPDEPNYTPRITAMSVWDFRAVNTPRIAMSILRKSPFGDECCRHLFEINGIGKGFGHCLTTYRGDDNPLPPFRGEPYLVPLVGNMEKIAERYWETLNVNNRVSIAVKFIPKSGSSDIRIINKYSKV